MMQAGSTELHYAIRRLLQAICELAGADDADAMTRRIVREFSGVLLNRDNVNRMIVRIYELCEEERKQQIQRAGQAAARDILDQEGRLQ
jgi:hypothetical protein